MLVLKGFKVQHNVVIWTGKRKVSGEAVGLVAAVK